MDVHFLLLLLLLLYDIHTRVQNVPLFIFRSHCQSPVAEESPVLKKERERRAKRCFLSNDFPFPTDSVCAAVDEASSSPPSHSLRFLSLCTVGYVGYAQGGENVVHQFFFLQKMDR